MTDKQAQPPSEDEQFTHVGWWCWRGDNHGHLATTACRSDNVPIHVPAEWADEMRAVIQRIEDGDEDTPPAAAGVAPAADQAGARGNESTASPDLSTGQNLTFTVDPSGPPLGFVVNPQTGYGMATGGNTPAADEAERRDQYKAAIRENDGWVLDDGQHMLDAVMAVADAEQAALRRERDLAVAHDRQPYPTAWAYEQACKALRRKTEAIERVERLAHAFEVSGNEFIAEQIRAAVAGAESVPPVAAPAGDRAALVDIAAQAIRDSNGSPEALEWWQQHPQLIPAHVYAAAVLAVLLDSSRAAVLAACPDCSQAAWERVRALHQPIAGDGGPYCETCTQEERQPQPVGWWVPYPCPTVQVAEAELRRMADEAQEQEPALAWAETVDSSDDGETIRVPGALADGTETAGITVRREQVPVLAVMLTDTAGAQQQPDTETEPLYPARNTWTFEVCYDPDGDKWHGCGGTYDSSVFENAHEQAQDDFRHRAETDRQRRKFRLVRATTTYTVEAEYTAVQESAAADTGEEQQ